MKEKNSILIVDDDESISRSLSLIFSKEGYETETAGSGQEAIEKVMGGFFNVAFIDIKLPDIEGINLIGPLKKICPDMVAIMITAFASLETAIQALHDGASGYIIKPFNMDDVLLILRNLLEKQHLIMENRRLLEVTKKELSQRKRMENKLKKTTQDLEQTVLELKKANQKIVEQQKSLIEEERIKVLLQMAGATAHELNQPLTVILPRIERSFAHIDKNDPLFNEMTIIYTQCVRMADLIKKISEIITYRTKPYVGNTQIIDIEKASHAFATKKEKGIPRNLLESFLNTLNHYSIIITDLSGKIIFFNKYSEELLGYSEEEVIHKKGVLLFSKREASYKDIEDCRAPAIQQGYYERKKTVFTKDGNEINIDLCFAPVKDRKSQIVGFVGLARRTIN